MSCIGRGILNHWTTREIPSTVFTTSSECTSSIMKGPRRELSSREQTAVAGCRSVLLEDGGGFLRERPLMQGIPPTITGESYLP